MSVSLEQFWEDRILSWERKRYDRRSLPSRLGVSRSITARLRLAAELLAPRVRGRHVLELGCGTGRLMPALLEAGAAAYTGIDVATCAIMEARARARALPHGLGDRAQFHVMDLRDLDRTGADLCVSLGVLDWITLHELERLTALPHVREHLHSFSERRLLSGTQLLHRAYAALSYRAASATSGSWCRPRYYPRALVAAALARRGRFAVRFIGDARLRFGMFAHAIG
jgi:SAM-dependent methyltransferase